jgi:hypothetical protein
VAGTLLRALDAALFRSDTQFVILQPENYLIAIIDTEGLAEGSGNYDSAILADARSDFVSHGKLLSICHKL